MPAIRQANGLPRVVQKKSLNRSALGMLLGDLLLNGDLEVRSDNQNAGVECPVMQRAKADSIPWIHALRLVSRPRHDMSRDQKGRNGQTTNGALAPIAGQDDRPEKMLIYADLCHDLFVQALNVLPFNCVSCPRLGPGQPGEGEFGLVADSFSIPVEFVPDFFIKTGDAPQPRDATGLMRRIKRSQVAALHGHCAGRAT